MQIILSLKVAAIQYLLFFLNPLFQISHVHNIIIDIFLYALYITLHFKGVTIQLSMCVHLDTECGFSLSTKLMVLILSNEGGT